MRRGLCQGLAAALLAAWCLSPLGAEQSASPQNLQAPLDGLLDLYVRDGLVYYGALKKDRGKLDQYLASLDDPRVQQVGSWPAEEQIAFWLNAYNATVLRTVIDNYPIHGLAANYPSKSVRQIPGAFDRIQHRVAGRSLTLDQIETTVLAPFHDPRLYLALGRGAIGSPRLRSEAYSAATLGTALGEVGREFASGGTLLDINEATGAVTVTPVFSWRQADFIAAYAAASDARYARRSPVEKALLAFVDSNLLPHEREFLEKNQFQVQYGTFDWRLNDLTGGRP